MRVIAALAWAGLRHRPLRWVLLMLGIAAGAVLPVVSAGLQQGAQLAAVRAAVDGLDEGHRAVFGYDGQNLSAAELTALDADLRLGWRAAGLTDPTRYLFFRPLSLAGSSFSLGAADTPLTAAAGPTRLAGGRLPTSCTPTRCEVLLVITDTGTTTASTAVSIASITPAATQLGLVITGTAALTDPRIVAGGYIDPGQPLLLGGSVRDLARLDALSLFGRTVGWISPLDGRTVSRIGAGTLSGALTATTEGLNTRFGALTVSWPQDVATAAAARAATSQRRFSVLGAGAAVLQLGFALVIATGLRRRAQFTTRLLTRRGAGRLQLTLTPILQVVVVTAVGTGIGAAAGLLVVAVGDPDAVGGRWAGAGDAVASAQDTLLWFALGAAIVTLAVASWPDRAGRATGLVVDALLVAAIGVSVLLLQAGRQSGTPGPLSSSAVTLLAVSAGLLTARVWSLLAALGRRAPPGPAARSGTIWRLALLGARRRPLLPAVVAGFVATATCAAVFAGSYRATLADSARAQAAFAVPLDLRVASSREVQRPLAVLDAPALAGAGATLAPVVASAVTVFQGTGSAAGLPLVGLDRSVLPQMQDFAATTGSDLNPADLANRLAPALPTAPPDQQAPTIPAHSSVLRIAASGQNSDIDVSLWVRSGDGQETQLPLRQQDGALRADLNLAAAVRVAAVEITPSDSFLVHQQHAIGEGDTDHALDTGTLTLGAVTIDGRPPAWSWTGWGSDHLDVTAAGTSVTARYRIDEDRTVLTPGFVAKARLAELPVAVDPSTAASAVAGRITVTTGGLTVPARVVATLPRLPTVGGRFVLADRQAVTALLERNEPGTAAVDQVWLGVRPGAADAVLTLLRTGSAAAADIAVRADIARGIADDPVAVRSATLLALSAILALTLAMAAAAIAVRVDRQDTAADLALFEVDGLPPAALRRILVLRAALAVVLGEPLGAVAGALVTTATVTLISTGAAGATVQPPLQVRLGGAGTLTLILVALVAGVVGSILAAGASFRERRLTLPDLDLR